MIVYGTNAAESEGERGYFETRWSRYNSMPLAGFPIHTIGTSLDVVNQDIQRLIAEVAANPDKIYIIENVGIGKKTNLGVETMAPLFNPLKDTENVYFTKEYRDYYQSHS